MSFSGLAASSTVNWTPRIGSAEYTCTDTACTVLIPCRRCITLLLSSSTWQSSFVCLVVTHLQVCNEQQQCQKVLRHAIKSSDVLHETEFQLVSDAPQFVTMLQQKAHCGHTAEQQLCQQPGSDSNCAGSMLL